MADYYFLNTGSTAWNSGANWSLTDGGAPAGVIPSTTDNAYFSNLSGNITLPSLTFAVNVDFTKGTGFTGLFTISSSFDLRIMSGGSLTLSPTMTTVSTSTGGIALNNCSLNFNGNVFNGRLLLLNNITCTVTLLSKVVFKSLYLGSNDNLTFSGNYDIVIDDLIVSLGNTSLGVSKSLTVANLATVVSTSAARFSVKSSTAGTKKEVKLLSGCASDFPYTNFTDISAIGGQTIFTYKGVITNCDNVQQLTQSISQISKGEIM